MEIFSGLILSISISGLNSDKRSAFRRTAKGAKGNWETPHPIGTPSLEYGIVYIGGFIDNNSRFVVKGFMK